MKRLLATLLLLLLGLACNDSPTSEPTVSEAEVANEKIKLVLNWFPEAEHGGFYAAVEHGYFAEEGLDVEILPGGVDVPVIQMVDKGDVDFGVTNADPLVIGCAQGADLVAVLAPIQTSPRCLVVRDDSPIKTFNDLHDITLAMSPKQAFAHFLQAKLPLTNVEIVGYPGNVAPLLAGQVDALQGYTFSEPFTAETQGVKTRSLMVSDLGFNPYASCLIVGREILMKRPDLVRRVTNASVRGWIKYLEDPAPTNARIKRLNPQMSDEILAYGAKNMLQLCVTNETPLDRFGTMTAGRWENLRHQLEELEIIKPGSMPSPEPFTNEFLPSVDEGRTVPGQDTLAPQAP